MTTAAVVVAAGALALPPAAPADEPPEVRHQQNTCTLADRPFTLCAAVRDDSAVATARVYFRAEGARHYLAVDMVFDGIRYCATLPGPRPGKAQAVEYYVQAYDDKYQPGRTSTYRLLVQGEAACAFPPVESDPARAAAIVVHATHRKQGKKLPGEFLDAGVSFVPAAGR